MKNRSLRVCMLAYTFYENDGRVIRYAESLAAAGAHVDVVALRRPTQPAKDIINGVNVNRIQARTKNEINKLQYLGRLLKFFFRSMTHVTAKHLACPYDVIHVHSVPDFEVFAAAIPKLFGAKLILDIHDIVPEFYAAKFKVDTNSLAFFLLKLAEKLSTRFADHVIIANALWERRLITRAVHPEKCSTFINYPDTGIFSPALRTGRDDDSFTMIYPGTLNWHQGLDIAVKAFAIASKCAPGMKFHIYGEGELKPELQRLVEVLELQDQVFLHAPMSLREIAPIMANADLGVVPKRNDSFGGDAFSTKVLEFMALGVPVLVSATRIDSHYFNDSLVRFFAPEDIDALAKAMVEAYHEKTANMQRSERALSYVKRNCWNVKRVDYLSLVERLSGTRV